MYSLFRGYKPASLMVFVLIAFVFASCKKEDVTLRTAVSMYTIPLGDTLPDIITENTAIIRGRSWHVKGIVHVVNEATLRIDSGVTIRMHAAQNGNINFPSSGIVVSRGSKIVAQGTRRYPIHFRIADITLYSPSAWNGILVMGKAPRNSSSFSVTYYPWFEYGIGYDGAVPDDSSGVLTHIMFEKNVTLFPQDHRFESGIHLINTGTRTVVKDIGLVPRRRQPLY